MTFDHVAVYTMDAERLADFYEDYFYAIRINDEEKNESGVVKTYLKFDGGVKLELIELPNSAGGTAKQPHVGYAHICICAGSRKSVDSVAARVFKAGYHVEKAPQITDSGRYESFIEDPDGNSIEITE